MDSYILIEPEEVLPKLLQEAIDRVGATGKAISEMNLLWAMAIGDPIILSDIRDVVNMQDALDEYYGIRNSNIQIHRVRASIPSYDMRRK